MTLVILKYNIQKVRPGGVFLKGNMKRVINYVKDTKGEMKHVSWPTRKQSFAFTAIVIAVAIFIALFLGFFDYTFSQLLDRFVLN